MKITRWSVAVVVSCIVASWASPGPGRLHGAIASAADRPMRVGLVQQPNSLDPLHAVQFYENYLAEAIFSALTVIDDRGNVSPDLAEVVPSRSNGGISADGKTLTYRLRRGVRWSDGVPLTSHDVAFTFRLMRDPKTNFPEGSVYAIVERIETPNDATVVVRLKQPWADAVSQLFVGGQDGSIVPEHVLSGVADLTTARFESAPIGSGPYTVERWNRGSDIVLRANPTYFRGAPAIGTIDVQFVPDQNTIALRLRSGELDFSPQVPQTAEPQLRGNPGLRLISAATYNAVQLGFKTTAAPFDDARVRRALVLAIDRTRLAETVWHGLAIPADDLVPPQSPAYRRDPHARPAGDPEAAGRLLDAAGWRHGADGIRRKAGAPLAFSMILQSGYAVLGNTAVQLQSAWRALGVAAELHPVPSNVLLAPAIGLLPKGDFQAFLVTNGYATSPDRSDTLTASGLPPAGRDYSRFDDPRVNALTEEARRTLDDGKRNALYAAISARVRAAAPLTELLWQKQFYAFSAKLTGLRPETVNSDFWNVYDWRFGS
jgi:peptide/nickel transport system substrate-binding protein